MFREQDSAWLEMEEHLASDILCKMESLQPV